MQEGFTDLDGDSDSSMSVFEVLSQSSSSWCPVESTALREDLKPKEVEKSYEILRQRVLLIFNRMTVSLPLFLLSNATIFVFGMMMGRYTENNDRGTF